MKNTWTCPLGCTFPCETERDCRAVCACTYKRMVETLLDDSGRRTVYRARCEECGWIGTTRTKHDGAVLDAEQHFKFKVRGNHAERLFAALAHGPQEE